MSDNSTSSSNRLTCPECGHVSSPRAVVCKNCGTMLREIGDNAFQTLVMARPPAMEDEHDASLQGTSRFDSGEALYISIERINTPLTRYVYDKPIILGREETTMLSQNDVNLAPYNARDRGVSRRHAQILLRDGELFIEDLESSNGTILNGKALEPHIPYRLRDGDEIILGRMMVWVNF